MFMQVTRSTKATATMIMLSCLVTGPTMKSLSGVSFTFTSFGSPSPRRRMDVSCCSETLRLVPGFSRATTSRNLLARQFMNGHAGSVVSVGQMSVSG